MFNKSFGAKIGILQDVTKSKVEGLTSCEYIDKVEAGAKSVEKNEKVTIAGEVDRVYKKVQDKILLETGNGSSIQIEKNNLKDTGKIVVCKESVFNQDTKLVILF